MFRSKMLAFVMLSSTVLLLLLFLSYREGYYFDFRIFWNNFKSLALTFNYNINSSLTELQSVCRNNFVTIDYLSGSTFEGVVLNALIFIANFLKMLYAIVVSLLAIGAFFINCILNLLVFVVTFVISLLPIFNESWVPIGTNGFIPLVI